MKRIISLALCLMMILTLSVPVMASGEEFNFSLLANGEAETTVPLGDIVEVTLEITRNDDASKFDLYTMQDYVYFNPEYLEYISATGYSKDGVSYISATPVKIMELRDMVYTSRSSLDPVEVELPFTAVTVRFKTLKEGTTTVKNDYVELLNNGIQYTVKENDAIIHIGDASDRRTLRFATNGGTAIAPVRRVAGTEVDLSEFVPTRPGNSFRGWYLEPEFATKVTSVILNEDMTVYAKWEASTLNRTLTFETYGGTEIPQITAIEGSLIDLNVFKPEKDGYEFDAWYTEPEFINLVGSVVLNGNRIIYARWIPQYTLTFEVNGGSAVDDIIETSGKIVDLTELIPTRDGYTFGGWYLDSELTDRITSVSLDDHITIYAKWLKDCTLTFVTTPGAAIDDVIMPEGSSIELSAYETSLEGFVLEGWYLEPDFVNLVTNIALNDDMTVYAHWVDIADCKALSFDTRGGEEIETIWVPTGATKDISGIVPAKKDFVFDGWYLDPELTTPVTSITMDTDKTVYANWADGVTVTFETNGGSPIESVTVFEGTEVDLSKYTTTKPTHVFLGWYFEPEFITPVTTILMDTDKTVYAKWVSEADSYTLTFNANGGTGVVRSKVFEPGTVVNLTLEEYKPQLDKFAFAGWYSDNGYTQEAPFVIMDADKTVYAKWIPYYTVTFKTNGGTSVDSVTVTKGTELDLSQDQFKTTKDGYTFNGWYKDEAKTDKATSPYTVSKNATLYAAWKSIGGNSPGSGGGGGGGGVPLYIVTVKDTDGNEIDRIQKAKGVTIDPADYVYEKDGFVTDGWYQDEELTIPVEPFKLVENRTVYTKWVRKSGSGSFHPGMLTTEHYAYIQGRDDGKVYPQANITRAEVATIFFRLLTEEVRKNEISYSNNFEDVDVLAWYNTAVSTLAKLGIIEGRTPAEFAPNAFITRAEFATIAARFSDAPYTDVKPFTDVEGHWAEEYINKAAAYGWIIGENGLFRPNDNITRAEVVTIVNRVLGRLPESEADLLEGMKIWPDNSDTDAWFYLAVQEATNSHNYTIKSDGVHESWTKLTETPDWSKFE